MPVGRSQAPLVSIGFPVYNEAQSLSAALDSFLAQDYENLEVLVCDNASTDETLEIAHAYAARSPRVSVHAGDVNRGQIFNFNRCIEVASGEYFTWGSGHDIRLPDAIRRCVVALEEDASLVLCYPSTLRRGFDGSVERVVTGTAETRGLAPSLRLRETVEQLKTCEALHGVIRVSALARTRRLRHCHGTDHVLLAELSLLGGFHQLDEELYIRVQNRPEEDQEQLPRILDALGVTTGFARSHPYTVMLVEHAKGAWHVSSGPSRLLNAWRAAALAWARWRWPTRGEWPRTSRLYALTVPRLLRAASRRTRAA